MSDKKDTKQGRGADKQKGLFADKRVVLIISLLISVMAWVVVAGFIQPGDYKVIPNIAINYTLNEEQYREKGLRIVSNLTDVYVDVEVNGDGAIIGPLSNTSLSVYADYSEVDGPGPHEVPIRVEKIVQGDYTVGNASINSGAYSIDNPKTRVTIVFEEVATEQFPISISTGGVTAAESFVMDEPVSNPESIYISGPKNQVEKVASVVARLDVTEELSESKTYTDVPLILRDSLGNELDAEALGLEITEQTVEVSVAIFEVHTLNLTADFINVPANVDVEWFYNRVNLSQDTLRVVGTSGAFENVSNPLVIGTFDITQLDIGWESTAEIVLPDGLSSYDQLSQVDISFNTSGMTERIMEIPMQNVRVLNGPQDITVTPVQDTLSVKLVGETQQLAALVSGNVTVQIDASSVESAGSGQQTVPAVVTVPGSDQVFAVGSYPVVCSVDES